MSIAFLPKTLQAVVNEILATDTKTAVTIGLVLKTKNNPDYTYTAIRVEHLDVLHQFNSSLGVDAQNVGEYIDLVMSMSGSEYQEMIANYQDMYAVLTLSKVNIMRPTDPAELILNETYRVIHKTMMDLTKQQPADLIEPENKAMITEAHLATRYNVNIQLFPEDLYQLRKSRHNFILEGTIVDTISLYAYLNKIRKINMPPPDNTKVYTNLVMPNFQDITSFFSYLQTAPNLGVYYKGMVAFFLRGTLYLYPPYDFTQHTTKKVVHIYQLGENEALGASLYYKVSETGDLHIITNSKSKNLQLNHLGQENFGSTLILQDATLLDKGWLTMNAEKKMVIPEHVMTMVHHFTEDKPGISKDSFNMRFLFDNGNPFVEKAKLYQMQRTIVGCAWNKAIPYLIEPGQSVVYHFANISAETGAYVYSTKRGRIASVSYSLSLTNQSSDRLYTGAAQLMLDLEV